MAHSGDIYIFTITAEILARSLANFYCQYADRRQRARAGNSTIYNRKKQIDVSFSCVCPVIDNTFRHNIVKVVYGSTRLSPRGFTATSTMLWRNLWSITGQMHETLTSICYILRSDSSTPSCMMTHRWRGVTKDRDKKAHTDLNCVWI